MKTLFFATAIATALLVSCSVEQEIPTPQPQGAEVLITFDKTGGDFNTRAFFDNTIQAEPHEKLINRATLYVCNSAGEVVMRKDFSSTDITSLSTSMVLPKGLVGQECTFYAVANHSISKTFISETDLLTRTSEHISNYNSEEFDRVNSGTRFFGGLPMSASKKVVVQPQGTPTNVSFLLKRSLAKVAVMVSVDENFSTRHHGGTIRVTSVQLINTAEKAMVVASYPPQPLEAMTSFSQTSYPIGASFGNLFYVGENPPTDEDGKVIMRISAIFDQNPYDASSNDQIPVSWDVKIEGSGNGEIRRNGYYRIQARIEGIDALRDIHSLIESGEWEVPTTPPTSVLN